MKLPESPIRGSHKRNLSPALSSHSLLFPIFSIPLPVGETCDYTVLEQLPFGYGFAVNFFQKFGCKHLDVVKTITFECQPQFDGVLREIITPKKGLLIKQNANIYFGVPKFCDEMQHTISIECITTTKELLDELLENLFHLYNNISFVDIDRTLILSDHDYFSDLSIKNAPSYTEAELKDLQSLFKPSFSISDHLVFMRAQKKFTHMIECDANMRDFLFGLIQFGLCIFVTAGDIAYGEAIIRNLLENCRLTHLSHMFGVISVRHPTKVTQKSPVDYFPEDMMKKFNVTSVPIDDSPVVWFHINNKTKIVVPCVPVAPLVPVGFSGRHMHNGRCVISTHNPGRLATAFKLVDTMFRSSGKVPSNVEPTVDIIASRVQSLVFGSKVQVLMDDSSTPFVEVDAASVVKAKLPRTKSFGKDLMEVQLVASAEVATELPSKACLDMDEQP